MKKSVLRIIFAFLTVLWLCFIWYNSAKTGNLSANSSEGVTATIANVIVKDFADMEESQKTQIIEKIHPVIRELAHAFEFFVLAVLVGLFVITYKIGKIYVYAAIVLGFCLLSACADEFHQYFVEGRTADILDVLVDGAGTLVATVIMTVIYYFTIYKREN